MLCRKELRPRLNASRTRNSHRGEVIWGAHAPRVHFSAPRRKPCKPVQLGQSSRSPLREARAHPTLRRFRDTALVVTKWFPPGEGGGISSEVITKIRHTRNSSRRSEE